MRVLILVCLLFFSREIFGQDSTSVKPLSDSGTIKALVRVDRREVPQNRVLYFTIEVNWQGDLDRYQIEEVETPLLSNLEIVGNASSNRVTDIDGVAHAVKTFEFELLPVSLGMAYIDGTVVSYRDLDNDKVHRLLTNRLQVEVIEPVSDSSSMRWPLIIFGFSGVMLFALGYLFIRKKRSDKADKIPVELTLLEDKYLNEIKSDVDLNSPDTVSAFSALAKHFKHYLSEKYHVPVPEVNCKEIAAEMNRHGIPNKVIEYAEEVLRTADVARFSGGQVEKSVLERAYTLVEEILKRNKTDFIEYSNSIEGNEGNSN